MSESKSPTKRQITLLFIGFLILFILVFALGVIVGKGLGGSEIKVAKTDPPQMEEVVADTEVLDTTKPSGDISQDDLAQILNEAKTGGTKAAADSEQDATRQIEIETTESDKKIAMGGDAEVNLKVEKPQIVREEKKSYISKNAPLPPVVPGGEYTIQVGSFKSESDAKNLQNKLKSKGYPAFLKQVTIGKDTWFRLRIGTFETKDQAKIYGDIILIKEPDLIKSVYATPNV